MSEGYLERKLNEFHDLKQGTKTMGEYKSRFMELLRYASYLNTEKLKVNKFLYGLNAIIKEKVRILVPKTLHEVVQRAVIVEEELVERGEIKVSMRPPKPPDNHYHSKPSHRINHKSDTRSVSSKHHGTIRGKTLNTQRNVVPKSSH